MKLSFNDQNQKVKFALIIAILCGLSACGKVDHEPRAGEYGAGLVNAIRLNSEQIAALNDAAVTKPKASAIRPEIGISFQGDAQQNPYRL